MRAFLAALAYAAVLAAAAPAFAQTQSRDTVPDYLLEGVTVTTTRSPVARDRIPQRIDVVTAADAEKAGARNVGEALRSSVAIDVIEFPGLLAGFSVRGFRPQYSGGSPRTLVLVDGRPAGTNNLAMLQTSGVERVEVLRGPASALYGPNAMGGIVNVVTRRSDGPISGRVAAGYGTFGAYHGSIDAGGDLTPTVDFDVTLSTVGRHRGYRVGSNRWFAPDSLSKTLDGGGSVRLPWTSTDSVLDFSRFGSRALSVRVGMEMGDTWRLDVRGEDFRADDVENPGDLNVTEWDGRTLKDAVRQSLDVGVQATLDGHRPSLRVYAVEEAIDYYDGPVAPHYVNFRTPSRTYGLQLQDAVALGAGEAVVGVDFTASDARSERFDAGGDRLAPFSPDSRIASAGLFGQARAELLRGKLTGSAGLRYDIIDFEIRDTPHLLGYPSNRERRGVVTPSGGFRYRPAPWLHLFGNAGRAFITPDPFFVAGYSEARAGEGRRSVLVTRGNAELRPETSTSWDAGVTLARADAGLALEVAYFHTNVHDRVASVMLPASGEELTAGGDTILSVTSYENVDEAEIRGIEARLAFDVARAFDRPFSLRAYLNGTRFLRATERFASSDITRRIPNVARSTIVAGMEFDDLRRFDARLSGRYVGERVDSDYVAWWEPGEIEYPSYLVADLHLGARIGDRYRATLDVMNLGDEDYFEVRGYNMPGRSLRLGVSAEF